jgi:hypothetical protein
MMICSDESIEGANFKSSFDLNASPTGDDDYCKGISGQTIVATVQSTHLRKNIANGINDECGLSHEEANGSGRRGSKVNESDREKKNRKGERNWEDRQGAADRNNVCTVSNTNMVARHEENGMNVEEVFVRNEDNNEEKETKKKNEEENADKFEKGGEYGRGKNHDDGNYHDNDNDDDDVNDDSRDGGEDDEEEEDKEEEEEFGDNTREEDENEEAKEEYDEDSNDEDEDDADIEADNEVRVDDRGCKQPGTRSKVLASSQPTHPRPHRGAASRAQAVLTAVRVNGTELDVALRGHKRGKESDSLQFETANAAAALIMLPHDMLPLERKKLTHKEALQKRRREESMTGEEKGRALITVLETLINARAPPTRAISSSVRVREPERREGISAAAARKASVRALAKAKAAEAESTSESNPPYHLLARALIGEYENSKAQPFAQEAYPRHSSQYRTAVRLRALVGKSYAHLAKVHLQSNSLDVIFLVILFFSSTLFE